MCFHAHVTFLSTTSFQRDSASIRCATVTDELMTAIYLINDYYFGNDCLLLQKQNVDG